jgi:hypothetical protein
MSLLRRLGCKHPIGVLVAILLWVISTALMAKMMPTRDLIGSMTVIAAYFLSIVAEALLFIRMFNHDTLETIWERIKMND